MGWPLLYGAGLRTGATWEGRPSNRFAREYGALHKPSRAEQDDLLPGGHAKAAPGRCAAWPGRLAGEGDVDGLVGAVGQAFGEGGLFGGVDGEVVAGFVGDPVGEALTPVAGIGGIESLGSLSALDRLEARGFAASWT